MRHAGLGGTAGAADALADLAAWAEARLHRLIEDAYAAILDRIPVYCRDQLVPAEDLRRSVACNLRAIVTAIGDPQAPLDLAAAQAASGGQRQPTDHGAGGSGYEDLTASGGAAGNGASPPDAAF